MLLVAAFLAVLLATPAELCTDADGETHSSSEADKYTPTMNLLESPNLHNTPLRAYP